MTPDQQFFFRHAACSYDPKVETEDQGRTRCAIALADAEALYLAAHKIADIGCEWDHDLEPAEYQDNDGNWHKDYNAENAYIWHRDESGEIHYLACLGSIMGADANYRRVIRAELALECADKLRELIA